MLTDGRTDITNLIDAFRNFAKKPKNETAQVTCRVYNTDGKI